MGEIISTDGGDDLNPFDALGLFLYPLEATENQRFSDAFRWHRKKPVLWSGLMEGVKYSTYFSMCFCVLLGETTRIFFRKR